MNSKSKKILALLAVAVLALAGVAWANSTLTLSGTHTGDYNVDWTAPKDKNNVFNVITGNGTITGNVATLDDISGVAHVRGVVLKLDADSGNTVTVAPAANKKIWHLNEGQPVGAVGGPTGDMQLVVNYGNKGTVVIKGAHNDSPTTSGGDFYNQFWGGTYVHGGTLSITNNGSLGLGWVALRAGDSAANGATLNAAGTTDLYLGRINEKALVPNQPLFLSYHSAQGVPRTTTQAFDATDPDTPSTIKEDSNRALRIATINVANTEEVQQTLTLQQGLDERPLNTGLEYIMTPRHYMGAGDPDAATEGADTLVNLLPLEDGVTGATGGEARWTTRPAAVARLHKTGNGVLVVESANDNEDSKNVAKHDNFPPIRGLGHRGGTSIYEGKVVVKGSNATTYSHHFNGYLGNTWHDVDAPNTNILEDSADGDKRVASTKLTDGTTIPIYFWNTTGKGIPFNGASGKEVGVGLNNNPLRMFGTSALNVNRSQVFSDFITEEGTLINVDRYTLAGVNYRPQIGVTLGGRDSVAAGKITGYADIVLHAVGVNDNAIAHTKAVMPEHVHVDQNANYITGKREGMGSSNRVPAQAMLTLANPNNEIVGQTVVTNGVLAIGGAKSIGNGELWIGTTEVGGANGESDSTATGPSSNRGLRIPVKGKAVFLGLADATFENPTFLNGNLKVKRVVEVEKGTEDQHVEQSLVSQVGALAAAAGTTVAYKNVTINTAFEINPKAVHSFMYRPDTVIDDIRWADYNTYPLWTGELVFGGVSADYYLGGSMQVPTQGVISGGTLRLNSYPSDPANQGFMNLLIRETGRLALADGIRDFRDHIDLQVDDDARIAVVLQDSDITTSQADAAKKDAMFTVRTIDATFLGASEAARSRRLVFQVDLGGRTLKAGQWIKVFEAKEDAYKWNNLHFQRESSTGPTDDLVKVDIAFNNSGDSADRNKIEAVLSENNYSIFIKVTQDIKDEDDTPGPTPVLTTAEQVNAMTPAEKAKFVDGANTISLNGTSGSLLDNVSSTTGTSVSYPVVFLKEDAPVSETRGADFVVDTTYNGTDQKAYMYTGKLTNEQLKTQFAAKSFVADNTQKIVDSAAVFVFTPTMPGATTFPNGDYTMAVQDENGDVIGASQNATVNVTTPDPEPVGGSSSGCDAGFGAFALLALGAAVVLRKKD